jgi:hypothetical protein
MIQSRADFSGSNHVTMTVKFPPFNDDDIMSIVACE